MYFSFTKFTQSCFRLFLVNNYHIYPIEIKTIGLLSLLFQGAVRFYYGGQIISVSALKRVMVKTRHSHDTEESQGGDFISIEERSRRVRKLAKDNVC